MAPALAAAARLSSAPVRSVHYSGERRTPAGNATLPSSSANTGLHCLRRSRREVQSKAAQADAPAPTLQLRELPNSTDGLFEPADWANCFQSQNSELDCGFAEVEGAVPADLKGTLFRVCPGSMEVGQQKCLHWLDGDGYVLAFSFPGDGGEPAIRSRYVDTHERVAEQAAGRVLYRNTFGTQPLSRLNAGDIGLKNPANTNVVYWGGKLLALWEAGAPYELLPGSLETVGPADLDGWVAAGRCPSSTGSVELDAALGFGAAHTAHPHVIPTAEGASRLASWKWQSKVSLTGGTSLCAEFREFDENWAVKSGRELSILNSPMAPHDFATTASSYVLTVPPMKLNLLPYLAGLTGPANCVSLTQAPMRMYVVPRNDPDKKHLEIETEALYYIHYANAFDDGEETVLRGSAWGPEGVAKLASNPRNGILGSWDDLMEGNFTAPVTSFWEHRIHRTTGAVTRRLLSKQSMDHPIVNPAFYGTAHRFAFFPNCVIPAPHEQSGPPQGWTRLDIETGEKETVYFGPKFFTEELVFVSREGSSEREDCGYLLGLIYSAEKNRSGLVVLDASDFEAGPLCTLWLDTHLPHGLHGSFTPQVFHA